MAKNYTRTTLRKVIGRPCSKCGCPETPKWYRKAHGKWGYASYCILCHREDQRIKNERWYSKKENRDKTNARSRAVRRGNLHYQEMARKSYWKHREARLQQKRDKYIPVPVLFDGRKRKRIRPSMPMNHPFRKFNFKIRLEGPFIK